MNFTVTFKRLHLSTLHKCIYTFSCPSNVCLMLETQVLFNFYWFLNSVLLCLLVHLFPCHNHIVLTRITLTSTYTPGTKVPIVSLPGQSQKLSLFLQMSFTIHFLPEPQGVGSASLTMSLLSQRWMRHLRLQKSCFLTSVKP